MMMMTMIFMIMKITNGFVRFSPASLSRLKWNLCKKLGQPGYLCRNTRKIFAQTNSQSIFKEILLEYLCRNTLKIFLQKYSIYIYRKIFVYKYILPQIDLCRNLRTNGFGWFLPSRPTNTRWRWGLCEKLEQAGSSRTEIQKTIIAKYKL